MVFQAPYLMDRDAIALPLLGRSSLTPATLGTLGQQVVLIGDDSQAACGQEVVLLVSVSIILI